MRRRCRLDATSSNFEFHGLVGEEDAHQFLGELS